MPAGQIEEGFADLVPICMELPVKGGSLDNVLVTPGGDIVLVECKLWRNYEARRKVVAQIIDYATQVSKWSYIDLEEAISRSTYVGALQESGRNSLYERVSAVGEIEEAEFVDRVSRNLRLGRFLLLIVGDGIQEGVRGMSEFLQQHAGLHFTLGLVEIALFRLTTGGYVVQPRVFARTTNIDRGIVTIHDARIEISSPSALSTSTATSTRKMPITKQHYLEGVEHVFPGIGTNLNAMIDKLPAADVDPEFGAKSIILRWYGDDIRGWNLGTIVSSGEVWFDYLSVRAREKGLVEQARQYLAEVAALIPGASVRIPPAGNAQVVNIDGKTIKVDALVADTRRLEGWLRAIARFQQAVAQAA
ncbi:hypothetical protein D1Y84_10555 [Acidipila sp. EB88]|nr:hypothetical protein D1Y84_10555 [Acidipila sp. EB88]